MAQWTSEYTILRDLSMAQGIVPVAIERPVGAGEKPPSLNITEETEEEYFKHCAADANVSVAPDLGLIQKMLDMVRDVNDWSDEEDTDKAVLITKLNPHVSEFRPKDEDTSTPTGQSPTKQIRNKPKKRQRNIALESILQGIEDNKQSNEVILRKPNDFMTVDAKIEHTDTFKELQVLKDVAEGVENQSSVPTATEKVKGWLETQTGSPFPKKANKVTLEATSLVFKKKEKPKLVENFPKQPLKILERSPISSSSNSGEYKPSGLATEYYKKYIERNKFKESVKEDIWTKAERKMKEIEEKKRREAAQCQTSASNASQASGLNLSFEESQSTDNFTERIVAQTKINRCLDLVGLPQHRHHFTEDCVVCEVMRKKPNKPLTEQNSEISDTDNDKIEDSDPETACSKEINKTYTENLDNVCSVNVDNACSQFGNHDNETFAYSEEMKNMLVEEVSDAFSAELDNAYSKESDKTYYKKLLDNAYSKESDNTYDKELDNAYSKEFDNTSYKELDNAYSKESDNMYYRELDNGYSKGSDNTYDKELDNAYSKESGNSETGINLENVESMERNVSKFANLNKSKKELTHNNVEISDLINKELAKFVENADLNRNIPAIDRSVSFPQDLENCDALDVENVYESDFKTEFSFEEARLI